MVSIIIQHLKKGSGKNPIALFPCPIGFERLGRNFDMRVKTGKMHVFGALRAQKTPVSTNDEVHY